jgi:hypothetical protein
MACLSAMPQRDAQRWRAFVSYHLKRLHECIADPVLRSEAALRDDVPRLQHWERFVRKYLLLGESFATKQYRLASLIDCNRKARKHFDALIYATQVAQQRYDMRWKAVVHDANGQPQDVLRVDLIHDVALAVTASAEMVFLELEDGQPLKIIDGRRPDQVDPTGLTDEGRRLVPRRRDPSREIRARAARVGWKSESRIRVALSWNDQTDTAQQVRDRRAPALHVTVFDLELTPRAGNRGPGVTLKAIWSADYLSRPAAGTVPPQDPERAGVEPRGEIEVNSLFGLPHGDGFLAGLDTSEAPLALLTVSGEPDSPDARWVMSPLLASSGREAPPIVSTPVRAVAACKLDDERYLGAAGAADGSLRFVVFDRTGQVAATDREPMLLVHPVNDVAFAMRDGDPAGSRVCYVGTETGESLCVLIQVDLRAGTITLQQLWRDLHDSPVVVVRPEIRPIGADGQPLLYDDHAMVIATQDGHLSIYHARRGTPGDDRLSVSGNYHFEGMRLDRIDLPARLTSFAIRRRRPGFLAACAHGELRYGELYAARGSVRHAATEQQLTELYDHVKQDKLFYGKDVTVEQKLAICAMVRIGGDALRNYALRRELDRMPWGRLDAAGVQARLDQLLHGLRPEVSEDRTRIKLIVRRVSANVLERSPEAILDDCRPGKPPYDRMAVHPRVSAVCEYLGRYLLDDAVQAQRGAVRVRMSIMHALFRANVLWLAALDEQSGRHIPLALRDALTACLRDEDRIVCVEALRAVAVVLRNISIVIERAEDEDHRELVRKNFFPLGLDTLQWLVRTVIENFARYRRSQSAPLSTPWSYVTVLVLLIRLFPSDALGLCEQLARRGLGGALETIVARLRGDRVAALRARIHELWIQPLRRRAEFVAAFDDRNAARDRLARYGIADTGRDRARATHLLAVYRRLALLWGVNNEGDIAALPGRHGDDELPRTGPLAGIASLLQRFHGIAGVHRRERATYIEELRRAIVRELRGRHAVPDAIRQVLEGVVAHWRSIFDPRTPTSGDTVLGHVLDAPLSERGNRALHAVEGEPQQMVMLLRYLNDANARDAFYCSARLGRELATAYASSSSFLPVFDIEPRRGQARMQRAELASDADFQGWLASHGPDARVTIAQRAGVQLARALRCLHAEQLVHGDLRAENVFVTGWGDPVDGLMFRLGDLQAVEDLRARSGAASRSFATLMIPSLLRKRVADDPKRLDLIALTLFVHGLLGEEPLEPGIDQPGLTRVVKKLRERAAPVTRAIATMLSRAAWRTAARLETGFGEPGGVLPEFEYRPLAGGALAKHDVFISYNRDDPKPAHALYQALVNRGLVPFIDEQNVTRKNWKPEVTLAMNQCRSFAVLVNKAFHDDSYQAKEASFALAKSAEDRLLCHVYSLDGTRPPALGPSIVDCNDITVMAQRIEDSLKNPRTSPEVT